LGHSTTSFTQCGQDIYRAITSNFYRGAAAVFLVYSVDNRPSFLHLRQWLDDFLEKGSKEAFIFLIGTKADLET
jgi:GTPase SAR1 family protein